MADMMRNVRLRWFGHMKERSDDAPVRSCVRLARAGFRRCKGMAKRNERR